MSDRIKAIKAFFSSLGANRDEITKAMEDEPTPSPAPVSAPAAPKPEDSPVVKALQATIDKQVADLADVTKRLKDTEDKAAALVAEKRRQQFVEKANALKRLPGLTADDHAELLDKTEAALGAEAFAKLYGVLQASNKAIDESLLYREIGGGGAPEPGSAWAEVVAKAADLRKAVPDISEEQAQDQVMARDAALSRRVLDEESGDRR